MGVKADYNPKLNGPEFNKHKRYFPQDVKTGDVDEWAAMEALQV
jgi:hypothetical protein